MFTLLAVQDGNLSYGLVLAVVGMAVVFVALSVLALLIAGLTRLAPPPEVSQASAEGKLDGRRLAVIAAAAAMAVGQNVRLERVQPVDSP